MPDKGVSSKLKSNYIYIWHMKTKLKKIALLYTQNDKNKFKIINNNQSKNNNFFY